MSEAYETVLNHLLFHKALISEHDGAERISRYVSMLGEIDQGMHVALRDPFEKAVAAAFELVIEKQLDPWDLDLARFTQMFLEKVQTGGPVNFVTAGKLIFMAWSILKLQSDSVLVRSAPPVEEAPADWDFGGLQDSEGLDFNEAVLDAGRLPIAEAIRRPGRRAVTLMELMDAFDDARRDAEAQLQIAALRAQAVKTFAPNFHDKVHCEDLSEDIGLTWNRILGFNGNAVAIADLVTPRDRWDLITVFVSVLFLAKMEKVKLWQKAYPEGDILVQRIAIPESLNAEELASLPEVARVAGGPATAAAAPEELP